MGLKKMIPTRCVHGERPGFESVAALLDDQDPASGTRLLLVNMYEGETVSVATLEVPLSLNFDSLTVLHQVVEGKGVASLLVGCSPDGELLIADIQEAHRAGSPLKIERYLEGRPDAAAAQPFSYGPKFDYLESAEGLLGCYGYGGNAWRFQLVSSSGQLGIDRVAKVALGKDSCVVGIESTAVDLLVAECSTAGSVSWSSLETGSRSGAVLLPQAPEGSPEVEGGGVSLTAFDRENGNLELVLLIQAVHGALSPWSAAVLTDMGKAVTARTPQVVKYSPLRSPCCLTVYRGKSCRVNAGREGALWLGLGANEVLFHVKSPFEVPPELVRSLGDF